MQNPSLKNGFLSIANELAEYFARVNIPGNEMRIVWTVWRKTWGWQNGDRKKDWDWISLSQFEKLTLMKRSNIVDCVKSLVVKRILLKSEKGLKFNQNYNEWAVSKRLPPVVKSIMGGSQKHNGGVVKSIHTKETITKETITKESNKRLPKKIIDGEKYRGQFIWFDFFLDRCKAKNIAPQIRPDKFRALEDEYRNRVAWAAEVKGCIAYCFDHDLKFINAGRLRNRMEMAIKIEANRKRFDAEDKQDKKNGFVSQSLPKKQSQDELSNFQTCTVCQNCMTQNENAICNSCAT